MKNKHIRFVPMKLKKHLLTIILLVVSITRGLSQPVITTQPQSRTNVVGTTATFSVEATNMLSLFYQRQKNLTDLSRETNATLARRKWISVICDTLWQSPKSRT
jgi:hypothetical protein